MENTSRSSAATPCATEDVHPFHELQTVLFNEETMERERRWFVSSRVAFVRTHLGMGSIRGSLYLTRANDHRWSKACPVLYHGTTVCLLLRDQRTTPPPFFIYLNIGRFVDLRAEQSSSRVLNWLICPLWVWRLLCGTIYYIFCT